MSKEVNKTLLNQLKALKDVSATESEVIHDKAQAIGLAGFSEYLALMETLMKLDLYGKMMPQELFHWWVANLPNNPVELFITGHDSDGKLKVALAQRPDNDPEDAFAGRFHITGSVVMQGETIPQKIAKLLKREVGEGVEVGNPEFITIFSHREQYSSRGHEECFLLYSELKGELTQELADQLWQERRIKFFSLDDLPLDQMIPSHREYIECFIRWLAAIQWQKKAEAKIGSMPAGAIVALAPVLGQNQNHIT